MKPQTGKYYKIYGGSCQYRKVYFASDGVIIFKEIFMSENRTRFETREIDNDFWLCEEITEAQFARIENLANARMDQYIYYNVPKNLGKNIFDARGTICIDYNSKIPEALCEEIDKELNISKNE